MRYSQKSGRWYSQWAIFPPPNLNLKLKDCQKWEPKILLDDQGFFLFKIICFGQMEQGSLTWIGAFFLRFKINLLHRIFFCLQVKSFSESKFRESPFGFYPRGRVLFQHLDRSNPKRHARISFHSLTDNVRLQTFRSNSINRSKHSIVCAGKLFLQISLKIVFVFTQVFRHFFVSHFFLRIEDFFLCIVIEW